MHTVSLFPVSSVTSPCHSHAHHWCPRSHHHTTAVPTALPSPVSLVTSPCSQLILPGFPSGAPAPQAQWACCRAPGAGQSRSAGQPLAPAQCRFLGTPGPALPLPSAPKTPVLYPITSSPTLWPLCTFLPPGGCTHPGAGRCPAAKGRAAAGTAPAPSLPWSPAPRHRARHRTAITGNAAGSPTALQRR